MQIGKNTYFSKQFTKIQRKIFLGNFGASAEESKFSPDAKESDSPGALQRRVEIFFLFDLPLHDFLVTMRGQPLLCYVFWRSY